MGALAGRTGQGRLEILLQQFFHQPAQRHVPFLARCAQCLVAPQLATGGGLSEPGMDMNGMDHSKMAGMDMNGMDHSKMAGMGTMKVQ